MHRNIIWDLDGTLFDTYPAMTSAFLRALQEHGKEADAAWVTSLATVSFDHCVAALSSFSGISPARIEDGFDRAYAAVPLREQPPFDGARRLCEHVQGAGGRNVIVTHRRKESTEGLLDVHGMRGLFAGWITASDGYRKKPDPQAFLAALRLFSLDPAETMGLGDRDIDSQAARAAGLFTCRFGSVPGNDTPDLAVAEHAQILSFLMAEEEARQRAGGPGPLKAARGTP